MEKPVNASHGLNPNHTTLPFFSAPWRKKKSVSIKLEATLNAEPMIIPLCRKALKNLNN